MCHCSLSPMFFSGYIFPLTTCRWDLFRSVKPSCVEVTWKVSPKNRNKNHDFTFNVQYIGIIYFIKSNKNQMNFRFRFMAFNATFKNISVISWQSVLLVEETGENHQLVASHRQTLSYNVVLSTPRHKLVSNSQL
jgi:hypothetical protein